MQKLYAYVDETGQDPRSTFFLVSVVITEGEREEIEQELIHIEKTSGKGRRKWMETRDEQRVVYIQQVLRMGLLKNKLYYAVYPQTSEYFSKTVLTVAGAITHHVTTDDYKATVLVDGLPRSLVPIVGTALRRLRIRTAKVRGVRKEEADALMRLADALCGFIRASLEGRADFVQALAQAKARGFIREL